ncbi:MAG: hypothetical protein IJ939_00555 [Clostridia bacterium]|nr:hypothetical protein [Clostridia bacterium]
MDNRSFCEEIEIAIYSDTELSDEQKCHIETCESCRALLSQINSMKNDLHSQNFVGIKDGEIANAVMSEIKDIKLASSKPRFKLTHHLGTAAAVVIILVAALMIKNPSDTNGFDKNESDKGAVVYGDVEIKHHVLSGVSDATAESITADTADAAASDDGVAEYRVMMKAAGTQSTEAPEEDAVEICDEESTEVFFDATDSPMLMFAADEEVAESATQEAAPEAEEAVNDAAKVMLKASPKRERYIFEGIEFLEGDENFSYNISLANERLYELYGEGYVLSEEKLKKLGVDNQKFLELAPTVTNKMFDSYKAILDIFE